MFRGTYKIRADEKGRLKVPAEYKRHIDEQYGEAQVYVTSRDGKTAEVYPMAEWQKIEQKAMQTPTSNPALKRFLEITNFYGQVGEMDAQGRVLLPSLLREKAALKGDLAVSGMLRYFTVRNWDPWEKHIDEHPLTEEDDQALSELGI